MDRKQQERETTLVMLLGWAGVAVVWLAQGVA